MDSPDGLQAGESFSKKRIHSQPERASSARFESEARGTPQGCRPPRPPAPSPSLPKPYSHSRSLAGNGAVPRPLAGGLFDAAHDERRPTRLVRSAEPATAVAVEVFVEPEHLSPVWIPGESRVGTEAGAKAIRIRQEELRQTPAQIARHFQQAHPLSRPGRAFHLERIPVEVMVALQCLDQQIVEGKPDRTSPVRVSSEQPAARFAGLISDQPDLGANPLVVGHALVDFRQGANSIGGIELLLVQRVTQQALESFTRRKRKEQVLAMGRTLTRHQIGDVAGKISSVFKEPLHPFFEAGQTIDDPALERFHREEWDEPDGRPESQGNRGAVDAQKIVVEAIFFVPQA